MTLSSRAREILAGLDPATTKLGDLRALAKSIRKDHVLALELWSTGAYLPRQLALLIMDPKQLSQDLADRLHSGMQAHREEEKLQLTDWLLANQLSKDKRGIALMRSWEHSPSPLQRRTFWYYQGRLRWVGQTPPPNSACLLDAVEERICSEVPEVQWAMNFTAGQIGVFEPEYRLRCIALGERTGLYRDEVVHRNCTPSYLPKFIAIQVAKLKP
ncbi:MAG: DNA alkylation repair protein [Chitinophagaceae bacterium]|nr:MAG: DNA alkylation repair protein [Chitinophagaceae bacterium]